MCGHVKQCGNRPLVFRGLDESICLSTIEKCDYTNGGGVGYENDPAGDEVIFTAKVVVTTWRRSLQTFQETRMIT